MKYEEQTGKTIQEAFEEYHQNNPKMYEKFKEYAFKAISLGKKKISFKLIMNVIRWEEYIETVDDTLFVIEGKPKRFKISDAYGSRYARLFVEDYPEHFDKIDLRVLRTA